MQAAPIAYALAVAALRGRMQYRANFLLMVVFGLVFQGTGFLFIWVVLSRFQALAGWTLGDIAFLYGLRLLVHGLYTVLIGGVGRVRVLVREGELDRYLVRPMPPLLQLVTINMQASSFGDLLGGVVLFATASTLAGIDWSAGSIAYLALAIIGGVLIEGAVQIAIAALTFKMIDTGNLSFLVDNLFSNFGNYPLKIFSGAAQVALTWAVPVAFVAYFPASVLLERTGELSVHPAIAYGAPLIGVVWFVAAYRFWRSQMANYQSTGS